jgi:hypothetical protein
MIVDNMVLVNLFASLVSVWFAVLINSKFLRPAILNRKRFTLYELRDKLAILAMKDIVLEKSEEYITLQKLINNSLMSTKEFRITRFLKLQSAIVTDKKLRKHLDSILEKIENEEMPSEYREIVSEFFVVAHDIYDHKTWLLRNTITPIILFFLLVSVIIKASKGITKYLENQRGKMIKVKEELEANLDRFAI